MRWKDKVEKYQHRLTNQNADDMICRRIWKGLGLPGAYTSQRMGDVEQHLTGEADYGELDIYRVMNTLIHCVKALDKPWPYTEYETLEIKENREVQERIDSEETCTTELPVFFCRTKDDNALTFALYPKQDIGNMFTPPYYVIKGNTYCNFVIQDTISFVKQFGPYTSLFERN